MIASIAFIALGALLTGVIMYRQSKEPKSDEAYDGFVTGWDYEDKEQI